MKRRRFLQLGTGATLAFLMNGMVSTALGQQLSTGPGAPGRRVLVLIRLAGGNDGLNTVIPLDQYANLAAARPDILIPEKEVLRIDGTLQTGLHPAMTGIRDMYNDGLVRIIQGVGFPDSVFAHRKAANIWDTASGPELQLQSHWLHRCFAAGSISHRDPPAGFHLQDVQSAGLPLSDQLQWVARQISSGAGTPVYIVSLGSFDTHACQVDPADHSAGAHASLLAELSDAVSGFYGELRRLGVADRVTAMTVSEFGRRIRNNPSGGTDHGTTAPVLVFGPGVRPGLLGFNPHIGAQLSPDDNLALQFDYRQLYASVLTDWFGFGPETVQRVLAKSFEVLPVFRHPAAGV